MSVDRESAMWRGDMHVATLELSVHHDILAPFRIAQLRGPCNALVAEITRVAASRFRLAVALVEATRARAAPTAAPASQTDPLPEQELPVR